MRDLRLAIRPLVRQPGMSALAIVALARRAAAVDPMVALRTQ